VAQDSRDSESEPDEGSETSHKLSIANNNSRSVPPGIPLFNRGTCEWKRDNDKSEKVSSHST